MPAVVSLSVVLILVVVLILILILVVILVVVLVLILVLVLVLVVVLHNRYSFFVIWHYSISMRRRRLIYSGFLPLRQKKPRHKNRP